ncbi:MAG: tetratricopeptide repeat protein [Alphaproteobacteria bacterium]|nr:tetratricopeptide repeat protein [Alphaproteobacteria bacterium]
MKRIKTTRKAKKSPVLKKICDKEMCCENSVWSWTIYVYWFIILFFIAATFYILGRSHEFLYPSSRRLSLVEERLLQYNDYMDHAKEKLANGDMEGAIADVNLAIGANATSDMYALRGEIYMQMGDYQKALNDFNSSIEMDGLNAVAFYDRALLSMRLEDYDKALNDINNALAAQSMKPSSVLSMRNLYAKRGQLNLRLKNWQGAVADYTNSLARSEGSVSADAYAERAEAYTALGEYQNAINDYTSAIRVISEQIQAASTQEERETQSSDAMSYFEKSAALNLNLGNVDASRNDLESAFAIAVALNDEESANRIQNLRNGLE